MELFELFLHGFDQKFSLLKKFVLHLHKSNTLQSVKQAPWVLFMKFAMQTPDCKIQVNINFAITIESLKKLLTLQTFFHRFSI